MVPHSDPVLTVSNPDSAPVSVASGMVPALVIVTHSPDPDSVSVSPLELLDDIGQGDVICTQPQSMSASQADVVTTRVGRHVRPPQRLIFEMSTQKVEDVSPSDPILNFLMRMFAV